MIQLKQASLQEIDKAEEIIEKILGIDIISKKIASLKSLITETNPVSFPLYASLQIISNSNSLLILDEV